MSSRSREEIIRFLTHLSRCLFSIYYFDAIHTESICVNCLLDELIIIRENYIRCTHHAVIISNILNLIICDICSCVITLVRPATACTVCRNILNGFLYTCDSEELENTNNLARVDPVIIAHN
jgi:GTP cyclohydrolase III